MAKLSTSFGAQLYRFRSTSRREAGNSIGTPYVFTRSPAGSALECAAILDALEVTTVFNEADLKQGRDLLERIVSMLTGLIKP